MTDQVVKNAVGVDSLNPAAYRACVTVLRRIAMMYQLGGKQPHVVYEISPDAMREVLGALAQAEQA